MKDKILEAFANSMGIDPSILNENTVIKDIIGFDSLTFVMLLSGLQEDYGIEIPLEKAITVETVGELIESARQV